MRRDQEVRRTNKPRLALAVNVLLLLLGKPVKSICFREVNGSSSRPFHLSFRWIPLEPHVRSTPESTIGTDTDQTNRPHPKNRQRRPTQDGAIVNSYILINNGVIRVPELKEGHSILRIFDLGSFWVNSESEATTCRFSSLAGMTSSNHFCFLFFRSHRHFQRSK